MILKSEEAKKERAKQKWELIMSETNNFGKGFQTLDRTPPGTGGGVKYNRITFSDPRVYGGRNKVSSIKKKTTKKK
jgi:hypothetical protein